MIFIKYLRNKGSNKQIHPYSGSRGGTPQGWFVTFEINENKIISHSGAPRVKFVPNPDGVLAALSVWITPGHHRRGSHRYSWGRSYVLCYARENAFADCLLLHDEYTWDCPSYWTHGFQAYAWALYMRLLRSTWNRLVQGEPTTCNYDLDAWVRHFDGWWLRWHAHGWFKTMA